MIWHIHCNAIIKYSVNNKEFNGWWHTYSLFMIMLYALSPCVMELGYEYYDLSLFRFLTLASYILFISILEFRHDLNWYSHILGGMRWCHAANTRCICNFSTKWSKNIRNYCLSTLVWSTWSIGCWCQVGCVREFYCSL